MLYHHHHHQLPLLRIRQGSSTHTTGTTLLLSHPLLNQLLSHPPNQLLPTSNHHLLRLLSPHQHEHEPRLLSQRMHEHLLLQLQPAVRLQYALFQVEDLIPVEDRPTAPVMRLQVWKIWSSLWQRSSHRMGPVTRWARSRAASTAATILVFNTKLKMQHHY
jgi:hypothetical protein